MIRHSAECADNNFLKIMRSLEGILIIAYL